MDDGSGTVAQKRYVKRVRRASEQPTGADTVAASGGRTAWPPS